MRLVWRSIRTPLPSGHKWFGIRKVGIPAEDTPIGSFGFAEAQQYAGHLIRFVVTAVDPGTYTDGFNEDGTVLGALPTGGLLVTFLVVLDGVPLVGSKQGSISIELLRTLSEPVDVQDYVSKIQNLQRTLQHVLSTVDSLQSTVNVADRVLSDSIAVADTVGKLALLSHTLTDSVGLYDASSRLLELDVRLLRDSVSIDDALSFMLVRNRVLSVLVDVVDSIDLSGVELTRALNDSLLLEDSTGYTAELDRNVQDSVDALVESLLAGINVVERVLGEHVELDDSILTTGALDRVLADSVDLDMSATRDVELLRALISEVELVSAVGVKSEKLRALLEEVSVAEDTRTNLVIHHLLTDNMEVTDISSREFRIYGEAVYVEFTISLEKE